MRGSAAWVSFPKLPVFTIFPTADASGLDEPRPGTVKFRLLRRLKNSARNLNFIRSLMGKYLRTAISILKKPGFASRLRGELPKVPMALTVKSEVSKY